MHGTSCSTQNAHKPALRTRQQVLRSYCPTVLTYITRFFFPFLLLILWAWFYRFCALNFHEQTRQKKNNAIEILDTYNIWPSKKLMQNKWKVGHYHDYHLFTRFGKQSWIPSSLVIKTLNNCLLKQKIFQVQLYVPVFVSSNLSILWNTELWNPLAWLNLSKSLSLFKCDILWPYSFSKEQHKSERNKQFSLHK